MGVSSPNVQHGWPSGRGKMERSFRRSEMDSEDMTTVAHLLVADDLTSPEMRLGSIVLPEELQHAAFPEA
jgi:hypothetical protein